MSNVSDAGLVVPNTPPEGWTATALGELFTFKNGLNKAKKFFGYGSKIVNYMDVFNTNALTSAKLDGRVFVNKQEIKSYSVRKGDVFFTRTSETANEIGLTSVMLDEPTETVFSGFVLRGRPKSNRLDDGFKSFCFSSDYVRSQIISTCSYTTRALTNGRALSAVMMLVPPHNEQHEIGSALRDIDAQIKSLRTLLSKKYSTKQAAMCQLLTGRLRLPGFSGAWGVTHLSDLLEQPATYGIVKSGPFQSSGTYMLRGGDIKNGRILNLPPFVTEKKSQEFSRTIVKNNDVMIAIVGYPGESAKAPSWLVGGNISRAVGLLRPSKRLWPDFLVAYLNSPNGREEILRPSAGSAQMVINLQALNRVPVPVIPLEEQTAIATILSDMDAEIAALEAQRDKVCALKTGMMQALLTGRIRLA